MLREEATADSEVNGEVAFPWKRSPLKQSCQRVSYRCRLSHFQCLSPAFNANKKHLKVFSSSVLLQPTVCAAAPSAAFCCFLNMLLKTFFSYKRKRVWGWGQQLSMSCFSPSILTLERLLSDWSSLPASRFLSWNRRQSRTDMVCLKSRCALGPMVHGGPESI